MAETTSQIARDLVEAAKRESSAIVAGAREGRRTVADAHHHLSVLNTQLDAALAFLIARDNAKAAILRARPRHVRYRLLIPRLPVGSSLVAIGLVALAAAGVAFAAGWWTIQRSADVDGVPPRSVIVDAPASQPVATLEESVEPSAVGTTAESPASGHPLLLAAEAWLDAYYRQDQGRMASLAAAGLRVSDERSPAERLPPGLRVERTLEGARVQVYGATAIVTAKMFETASEPGSAGSPATVGFIYQMWSQQAGGWRLTETRIVSADAVSRAFRR